MLRKKPGVNLIKLFFLVHPRLGWVFSLKYIYGPNVIKLFLSVICGFSWSARVLVPCNPLQHSLMIVGEARSQPEWSTLQVLHTSTPVLIRHQWQPKTVVFQHCCLIYALLFLNASIPYCIIRCSTQAGFHYTLKLADKVWKKLPWTGNMVIFLKSSVTEKNVL